MSPTAHLTRYYKDHTEYHVPHFHFILLPYTTPHGPHLEHHLVPPQIRIQSSYLGNILSNPNYRLGTYGKMQMHKGGR